MPAFLFRGTDPLPRSVARERVIIGLGLHSLGVIGTPLLVPQMRPVAIASKLCVIFRIPEERYKPSPRKIILKRKQIRLDEIKIERGSSRRIEDVGKLAASIRNLGLGEPLLVNPSTAVLISGHRRYCACKENGMKTVRASFPEDVAEACDELAGHVTDPDPRYAMAMSPRERLELALRLARLGKPSGCAKFDYDACVAPAVGWAPGLLWRIRSTFQKAAESEPDPMPEVIAARKALAFMLQAVEEPPEGLTPRQVVAAVHAKLRQGDVPDSLDSIIRGGGGRSTAEEPLMLPAQQRNQNHVLKRTQVELRRSVDTISGTLSGLQRVLCVNPPEGDTAKYLRSEFKKYQRDIRQMLKCLPEEVKND